VTTLFPVALSLLAIAVASESFAQALETRGEPETVESTSTHVTSYPAGYFADLGALNAQDMVRLVPGFTFDSGESARGYSGVGGNVLINGRRPSTKTTRLGQLLRRIQIESIERIEVIRGGTPGIDMQGLPVVANIVRHAGVSDSGALSGLGKFYPNGDVGLVGDAERTRQGETTMYQGSISLRREQNDEDSGEGRITASDAAGNMTEQGLFISDNWATRMQGTGAVEKQTSNGLFRANSTITHNSNDEKETSAVRDPFGVESQDVVDTDFKVSRFEIGADYDGKLGESTSFQVVALQALSRKKDDSSRTTTDELQISKEEEREGETILRGLVRRRISPTLNFEAGAEGAFNFLNADSRLTVDGQVIDLPAANVDVEEIRGEIFSALIARPSTQTAIELGLAGETSQITVSGDADAKNRFSFVKPRVVATYSPDSGVQLRFRVEREVGQLDFEDFAAGSELTEGTVDAGNPDLAPESSWIYELAYEQPMFGDSIVAIAYRHFELEDVVDLIPVEGFAAPGNIGDGTRDEIDISLTVPLEKIGPNLGRLQFSGTWRESEVVDPVTGEMREISDEARFEGGLLYTRDFPALNSTFGMRGELTSKATSYRLDQVITERNENYWRVYWDWRARPNLLVRAQIENPTSRDRWRKRVRYDGLRSDGVIESRDYRSAVFDPFLVLRVRWTF